MEHLLIHPPFADPTQPYLSLPTLKGALRANGLDARVVDWNVEAAHFLFEPATLEAIARRLGSRFIDLNRKQELSFQEALEYRRVVEARPKIEHVLGAEVSPVEVFRSRERFYDAAQYALARRHVDHFFEALSAAHFPYRFSFNHAAHAVVPWSFDLLETYATRRQSPLVPFYERCFTPRDDWDWADGPPPWIDGSEIAFAGISVVFPSQVPEALALCRILREHAPRAFLALGGPCVHQIVVHMEPRMQQRVLDFADGVGLFEGERLLLDLLPRLDAWRGMDDPIERFELLRDVPNLLQLQPIGARASANGERASVAMPAMGPRLTEDLRHAEPPDYEGLDLDRYLAPSRTLLYAPTRGCYWNQCSFCYYGLSETATATYREVPPDKAAAQIAQLARRHGVKNFYISCDVLSPAYALRLADALIEKDVKIRWSSDLKIEKYFTPERCQRLYESGLRSAAFGIESGSDRILELMRKGCDRATMTAVNRAFHDAGVATEWMTFTDHPDESTEEALETVQWIADESEYVDLFLVGRFGLERGSHVAQDPTRYGVRKVYYADGDELQLYALFTHKNGRRSRDAEARIEREIDRVAAPYDLHPYPWAGANSTHHTFLHFLAFGPRVFRTHFQRAGAATHGSLPPPPTSHITGLRERPRFSLEKIAACEERFFEGYLSRALYTTIPSRRQGGAADEVAPLSIGDYEAAAASAETVRA